MLDALGAVSAVVDTSGLLKLERSLRGSFQAFVMLAKHFLELSYLFLVRAFAVVPDKLVGRLTGGRTNQFGLSQVKQPPNLKHLASFISLKEANISNILLLLSDRNSFQLFSVNRAQAFRALEGISKH